MPYSRKKKFRFQFGFVKLVEGFGSFPFAEHFRGFSSCFGAVLRLENRGDAASFMGGA